MKRLTPYGKFLLVILLPLLSFLFILVVVPRPKLAQSPNFDLVYASPGYQFSDVLPLAPELDEKKARLTFANKNVFQSGLDPQELTAVYVYDFDNQSNTRLTVDEVEKLELDAIGFETPDGFAVECVPTVEGVFPLGGVWQDCSRYQLVKDGEVRFLELIRFNDEEAELNRSFEIRVYGWIMD